MKKKQVSRLANSRALWAVCVSPFPAPVGCVKETGPRCGCFTRLGAAAVVALGVRPAPVTAASRSRLPRPGAAADLGGRAASSGGMGGEAGADGPRGRVKSLGLVFEDESKGCYSSGETVAGHVLLEAAEPVALCGLRLEAQGRATSAWGPSAGARVCIGGASPAASSEVEYLNLCLSLLEAPAGKHGNPQGGGGRGRAPGWWVALREASGRVVICCEGQKAKPVPLTWLLERGQTLLYWCAFELGFLGSSSNPLGSRCHGNLRSDCLGSRSFLTWRHGRWKVSDIPLCGAQSLMAFRSCLSWP